MRVHLFTILNAWIQSISPPSPFRYIPSVQRAEILTTVDSGESTSLPTLHILHRVPDSYVSILVWAIHYSFPNPISPRVFTQLQYIHPPEPSLKPRTAYVITIPFDVEDDAEMLAKQGKGVHGKYVSVERLLELEDGSLEWRYENNFRHFSVKEVCSRCFQVWRHAPRPVARSHNSSASVLSLGRLLTFVFSFRLVAATQRSY